MNIPKTIEWYTLNGSTVWYENYSSIKLFPQREGANGISVGSPLPSLEERGGGTKLPLFPGFLP